MFPSPVRGIGLYLLPGAVFQMEFWRTIHTSKKLKVPDLSNAFWICPYDIKLSRRAVLLLTCQVHVHAKRWRFCFGRLFKFANKQVVAQQKFSLAEQRLRIARHQKKILYCWVCLLKILIPSCFLCCRPSYFHTQAKKFLLLFCSRLHETLEI